MLAKKNPLRSWRRGCLLPVECATNFVFGDSRFKEVFFFGKVNGFRHPWKRVSHMILRRKSYALQASIGNMFNVLLEVFSIHAKNAFRKYLLSKGVLEHSCF